MLPPDVDVLADIVTAAIKEAQAPLLVRIAVLESRDVVKGLDGAKGDRGDAGPAGRDGADAPAPDLDALAARVVALMPVPVNGKDGKDGISVDLSAVKADALEELRAGLSELVALEVTKAVAAIPAPKDGRDGQDADPDVIRTEVEKAIAALPLPKDGERGPEGQPGRDGKDADPTVIRVEVEKAIAAIPTPKDGRDGRAGVDGKDGVGVAGALLDKGGHLVVTLSDGRLQPLGVVMGEKGADGKDGTHGRDGLGFDDLGFDHDEHGRLSLRFQRGDVVKSVPVPCIVDRGVYKDGTAYLKGDGTTWGGSFFIAQKDTSAKPDEHGGDWRLAVKRGREGREGKPGPQGVHGLKGDRGDRGPGWT